MACLFSVSQGKEKAHDVCIVMNVKSAKLRVSLQALRRLQILFIDSDLHMRNKMQQLLGNDFALVCVGSINEAKASLTLPLPDILIAEVQVGQENGLDLCRYIRNMPALRHLPIMLLTSMATLQDKVDGFEAGTDDYVVKPFDAHHLMARIRLLARIKRLERRTSG
jgi:DNA-binding response OmpR family regulator